MKIWRVFVKSLREQFRDYLTLSLSLAIAPGFVFIYWLFFPSGGSTTYAVLLLSQDQPVRLENGAVFSAEEELLEALYQVTYSDGQPILSVDIVANRVSAEEKLMDREAAALLLLPENFSQTILAARSGLPYDPVPVTFVGDLTNPYYAVAAVMANAGLDTYIQFVTNEKRPVQVEEIPLGDSIGRTEFETYVPGMLIFSIVLLVFQASMVVAYEVESGTLRRLKLSRVSSMELLAGISLSVVLIGIVSLLLAFVVAVSLGFTSEGPLWIAILIGVITCFSVIGVGLMVAAASETISQAFIIANFPLVVFMFFTGMVFPIRGVSLFRIGGRMIGLYDILPPTHAVAALNKVLTLGVGLEGIGFEITALLLLSLLYFILGVWLFNRRHMNNR